MEKMETTSLVTQSNSSAFDRQQVAKNKRKKFNPKFMMTNSSSDDDEEGGGMTECDYHDQREDKNQRSCEDDRQSEQISSKMLSKATNYNNGQIPTTNFSINKSYRSNIASPPLSGRPQITSNPFISASNYSLLQTLNLQQQQHMFQQAAIGAIAPQFSQQSNLPLNLNETETKFREFALKTMQELLNIYGLTLPPNEIIDAMKNQHISKYIITESHVAVLFCL